MADAVNTYNNATGVFITDIARGSLHDGPGVRSVVYYKGCTLRCAWCHNPETLSPEPEILAYPARCIGCGRCASVCPLSCHIIKIVGDGGEESYRGEISCRGNSGYRSENERRRRFEHTYDRERCGCCGKCAEACPGEALVICGKKRSPADLFAELIKDKVYYRRTGGGVTLSGGECLLYPDDAAALLELLKAGGVHTVVETSLCVPWLHVEKVAPLTDVFLVDIKHMDSGKHAEYTGRGNELILENLRKLSAVHNDVTIRTPLIPGVNDDFENLSQTARAALSIGGGIRRMELLKYNTLGASKYAALGQKAAVFAPRAQSDAEMDEKCATLNQSLSLKNFIFYRA